MRYWRQDMDKDSLDYIMFIKQTDVIRPMYKLLVLIHRGVARSDALKDVLGGNYIVLVKEAMLRGLVEYERGKPPRLTEKGRELASVLDQCLANLWERERARETGGR